MSVYISEGTKTHIQEHEQGGGRVSWPEQRHHDVGGVSMELRRHWLIVTPVYISSSHHGTPNLRGISYTSSPWVSGGVDSIICHRSIMPFSMLNSPLTLNST